MVHFSAVRSMPATPEAGTLFSSSDIYNSRSPQPHPFSLRISLCLRSRLADLHGVEVFALLLGCLDLFDYRRKVWVVLQSSVSHSLPFVHAFDVSGNISTAQRHFDECTTHLPPPAWSIRSSVAIGVQASTAPALALPIPPYILLFIGIPGMHVACGTRGRRPLWGRGASEPAALPGSPQGSGRRPCNTLRISNPSA